MMTSLRPFRALALVVGVAAAAAQSEPDWPHWRGPARDGMSSETGWTTRGRTEPLWSVDIGLGYSSVAIAGSRVLTMGFDEEQGQDRVFCFDVETGRELWRHAWPAEIRANFHGGGTLTTPTIDGEVVFVTNREGRCFALSLADGTVLWQRDYTAELGLKVTFHGFAASPLALADRLVLELGGTMVAVDKKAGAILWRAKDEGDGGYSNPVPFTLRDEDLLAQFAGSALVVRERDSGKERYRYPWKPKSGGINSATPIVFDDRVFISTAYNQGSALLRLGDEPKPELLWRSRQLRNKCSGCVLYEGHVYGFDESMLCCIGLDGKRRWRQRGLGMGSLTIAGGRLIVLTSDGELLIGAADPTGFTPEHRAKVLDGGVYWTSPVLVRGLLFCRNSLGNLVCLDHRRAATAATATAVGATPAGGEGLPAAEALFARHAQRIGGATLLARRSVTMSGTVEIRDVGLLPSPLRILLDRSGNRLLTIDQGQFGIGRYGCDAELAWELDPMAAEQVLDSVGHRELIETMGLHSFADWRTTYKDLTTTGRQRFGGRDCWVVAASSERGAERQLFFDCSTGYLAGHDAAGEALVRYSDWRAFDGIEVATTVEVVAHDTGNEQTRKITAVRWDDVDPAAFERPAAVTRMLRTPEQIEAENVAARAKFAAELGSYTRVDNDGRERGAKITVSDGYLSLEPERGGPLWFLPPDDKGVFAGRDRKLELVFTADADGRVTGMKLQTPRGSYEFRRKR
ncbi:MAG: PQQ-like beta-propeller repeat protein [bacterium]|nr:PQQ-like beta-propeller repeat protein [bacterium]